MSSLPPNKSQRITSSRTHSPLQQQSQQIPSPSQTLNHQHIQRYALNSQPRHSPQRIPSLPYSRSADSSLPPSTTTDLPRPPKRKMDINSQLQAAVSYHAALNANGPMHMNGALNMNGMMAHDQDLDMSPPIKKARTNTPWTAEEEKRLKELRDIGTSWNEIAKSFPNRTEGSVKKHWYKDMHYAEFTEEEKLLLFDAIREYDANKWKSIGNKVGKPAKACEQFAREHFSGR